MKQLYILDTALQEIEQNIVVHAPERGGALLGPPEVLIVTHFLFDRSAQTNPVTYQPSRELAARVKEMELTEGLEFKGIIHSHPGGLDRPSLQDEWELRVGLEVNPHLDCYLAPIVTTRRISSQGLNPHELTVGSGKTSFYTAFRQFGSGVRVVPQPVTKISRSELLELEPSLANVLSFLPNREVDMKQHLEQLGQVLGSNTPPEIFPTQYDGTNVTAGRVLLEGLELLFLFDESYPTTPPLFLLTPVGKDTQEIQLPWSLQHPAEERLNKAVQSIITPPGPYHEVYGPSGGPGLTTDGERARLAGWTARYTGLDFQETAQAVQQGLFARSSGLLSEQLQEKHVMVVGVGSVGSYTAEQLVRSGIGAVTLIDPDTVEPSNLSRTVYDLTDLGRPKVEALARRLLHINPLVEITLESKSVLELEPAYLDTLVRSADLVIAATDEPRAQRVLNHFTYARHKPILFVGLYAGAQGGEVIFSLPEQTPCYLCATSKRHGFEQELGQVSATMNYGTGRLEGEVALAADIHHVASAAVKMALSLILPAETEAQLKNFLTPVLEAGSSYLTLSMVSDYWFYPHLFGAVSGQYAYQSVWLTPERREACPVCGKVEHRVDPLEVPLQSPRVVAIREQLGEQAEASSSI